MSRGWFVARIVMTVLVIALAVGGGYALYGSAWNHGYAAGLAASDGGAQATAPLWYGHPYAMRPHGFGLGLLFAIGLAILFFAFIGRMFRMAFWSRRMAGGSYPPDPRWAKHWAGHKHMHHPHGPMPPWCWGEPPEEQAEKSEKPGPGAEGGEAA
jgi:hypothetical protein